MIDKNQYQFITNDKSMQQIIGNLKTQIKPAVNDLQDGQSQDMEDELMDMSVHSLTFEVDLSAFNTCNVLNKSSDHILGIPASKNRNKKKIVAGQLKEKNSSKLWSIFESKKLGGSTSLAGGESILAKNLPRLTSIYYTDKLIHSLSSNNKSDPFYEHFLQSAQSLVYIKNKTIPEEDEILNKKVYLPPLRKEGMKTIVFDLDETLIHCNDDDTSPSDMRIPIKFSGGEAVTAGLNIRPFARQALKTLSKTFEIVIFTASHICYANEVLNILDPDNKFISYRMYRDSCVKTEDGIFIKDLRVFGNRKISDILLVDNAFYSYGYQLANGVPILPFYNNKHDTELKDLTDFLLQIEKVRDVRDATSRFFMYPQFMNYCEKPETLVKVLMKERSKIL